tara:strand:- start:88 stop:411 length:324 start_codon:yes stop_codon:yes gene_type:complete
MIANTIINNSVTEILKTPTDGTVVAYAGVGMFLCNNGGSSETVNLYAVQNGGSASDSNIIIKNLTVNTGDTYEFSAEKFLLNSGESIIASGTNGSLLTATITYTEIS